MSNNPNNTMDAKLATLTEIIHYGLEWLDGYEDFEANTALETIAHQIACCLCQWYGFESVETGGTRDFFEFHTNMSKEEISIKLLEYIKLLES